MKYIKLIVVAAISLFATTQAVAQQRVVFSPQWTPQAQFAGYYAAQELGFYNEVGLDVEIVHPNKSVSALQMLKRKQSDFVTLDLITAIDDNLKGGRLRNILQTSQMSGFALISHKSIDKIEDLEGMRIGQWRAGFSLTAHSAIDNQGVNVEWIDILEGVNVFLSKAVDANLVMTYNELLTIEETGYEVNPNQVIYFRDVDGCNIPEEGIYTSSRYARLNPETVKKFREASIKGWLWVRENREQALDIVMKWVRSEAIPTNRLHQQRMLEEILYLQIGESGESFTTLSSEDFEQAQQLLLNNQTYRDTTQYRYNLFIRK
ncbi:MAG: ABC transporter substrate-binding protein [Rikenellaceae bacterium]